MAGMGAYGAGSMASGQVLGAIGDIVSAASYKRPKLKLPGEAEQTLRTQAFRQLRGAGLEEAGGQALYNQLVPLFMSQLPGMSAATPSATAGGATGGGGDTAGISQPGAQSYSDALANYNASVGLSQQKQQVLAQMKTAKPGPARQALKQQLKSITKSQKGMPSSNVLEKQIYSAASNTPNISITQGSQPTLGQVTGAATGAGETTSTMSPSGLSGQPSLAQILGYMHGSTGQAPDMSQLGPSQSPPGTFDLPWVPAPASQGLPPVAPTS